LFGNEIRLARYIEEKQLAVDVKQLGLTAFSFISSMSRTLSVKETRLLLCEVFSRFARSPDVELVLRYYLDPFVELIAAAEQRRLNAGTFLENLCEVWTYTSSITEERLQEVLELPHWQSLVASQNLLKASMAGQMSVQEMIDKLIRKVRITSTMCFYDKRHTDRRFGGMNIGDCTRLLTHFSHRQLLPNRGCRNKQVTKPEEKRVILVRLLAACERAAFSYADHRPSEGLQACQRASVPIIPYNWKLIIATRTSNCDGCTTGSALQFEVGRHRQISSRRLVRRAGEASSRGSCRRELPVRLPELLRPDQFGSFLTGIVPKFNCFSHAAIPRHPQLVAQLRSEALDKVRGNLTLQTAKTFKHSVPGLRRMARLMGVQESDIPDMDPVILRLDKLIADITVAKDLRRWLVQKKQVELPELPEDVSLDANLETLSEQALQYQLDAIRVNLQLPEEIYFFWAQKSGLFTECLRQYEQEHPVRARPLFWFTACDRY
jgi:hypothetical protein